MNLINNGPANSGLNILFKNMIEGLTDCVSFELMTQAVSLNCGHSFNEQTILDLHSSRYNCPTCRTPIIDFKPNYTIRNLASEIATSAADPVESQAIASESSEPENNEQIKAAEEHFRQGRALCEQGLQDAGVQALYRALELNPNYEKALDYLEFVTDPKHKIRSSLTFIPQVPPKPSVPPLDEKEATQMQGGNISEAPPKPSAPPPDEEEATQMQAGNISEAQPKPSAPPLDEEEGAQMQCGYSNNYGSPRVVCDSQQVTPSHPLNALPPSFDQMQQVLRSIAQGDQEAFVKLIQQTGAKEMRDLEKRSLLHHSVTVEDPFFTNELLKLGLSSSDRDDKEYLPIHYAAMAGHPSQLEVLIKNNKKEVHAQSNQGATPLIVAIQNGREKATACLLSHGAEGDEQLKDGCTALHCAVHNGKESLVRLVIEESTGAINTIDTPTNEGIVPLMTACRLGSLTISTYLIEKGADPKLMAANGTTALKIAVNKNHFELCCLLVPLSNLSATTIEAAIKKSSLEINQIFVQLPGYLSYVNRLNETPLLMAIRYANIPVAMLILGFIRDKADLNVKNRFKETAVVLAIKGKFYPLLEELLKRGAQIDPLELFELLLQTGYQGQCPFLDPWLKKPLSESEFNHLALAAAKAGNHAGISKLLLPQKGDLSKVEGARGWKIDHYLAKSDGIYLIRMRFQETQDPLQPLAEEYGKTLPYIAGENGSWRVLEFLIDKLMAKKIPLEKHYMDRHLFYSVLRRGELEGVRLFVEKIGDPQLVDQPMDLEGSRPVHLAAQFCSLEVLGLLHHHRANFNVKDAQGRFPLYYAVQRKDEAMIRFLLEEEHSNLVTADTLYLAASFKNEKIFHLLLASGADPNECLNPEKDSGLCLAIKRHSQRACLRLVQAGASVNHRNEEGWTPFLLASYAGNIEMMRIIFSKHPQVATDKINGENALHLACQRGHDHCVRFLIEKGFSNKEANAKGQAPKFLARGERSVIEALEVNPVDKRFQEFISRVQVAITNTDFATIIKEIKRDTAKYSLQKRLWPVNQYFTVNVNGKTVRGTILHLALTIGAKREEIEELFQVLILNGRLDFNLRDSAGNSYAHLMVRNQIDPSAFSHFDEINDNQETPWHWAARGDNERFLHALKPKRLKDAQELLEDECAEPNRRLMNVRDDIESLILKLDKTFKTLNKGFMAGEEWTLEQLPIVRRAMAMYQMKKSEYSTLEAYKADLKKKIVRHRAIDEAYEASQENVSLKEAQAAREVTDTCEILLDLLELSIDEFKLVQEAVDIQDMIKMAEQNRSQLEEELKAKQQKTIKDASAAKMTKLKQKAMERPNIDPIDRHGRTPLFDAIRAKRVKNVKVLAKFGANLEHRDQREISPLILACQIGSYPVIRALVDLGADVNGRGCNGLTPLSVSLKLKQEDISLFLSFNGAKLNSESI